MRAHFKTDWHRYNIKRKLQNKGPLTEDAFEDQEEVSSIDGSESEEETVSTIKTKGSPFVKFQYQYQQKQMELLVYKQVLDLKANDESAWIHSLKERQKPQTWTLLMLASGHFSGAIFDSTNGKMIVHKTFHRYTTRRKQGGAQSGNDNSKGKAKSVGAQLRRANEQALQEDVQSILKEWKSKIDQSSLVFVRATGSSQKTIYFDDQILSSKDPRIRSYPLSTKRPTLSELERCYEIMTTVKVQEVEQEELLAPEPKQEKTIQPKTHLQIGEQDKEKLDEDQTKVVGWIKKGKVEQIKSHFESNPDEINVQLPDHLGISYLHIAADEGEEEIVECLLELGADPTKKGQGRQLRPYDMSDTKQTRDTFRRFMARYPDRWDYKLANIPSALTPEVEQKQKKEREERERQEREQRQLKMQEAQKKAEAQLESKEAKRLGALKLSKTQREAIGMTPEQRQRLDREKRALAAEARMKTQQNKCSACGKSLVGLTPFEKQIYKYCSMDCVKKQNLLFD
ncbi:hypothetical protein EDD86DRAFT_189801 [Gorgonomyces haynaldii]|nr:hypothetical protein EDD86DRAFT_189801 [Gorgonomyces haynaldii]